MKRLAALGFAGVMCTAAASASADDTDHAQLLTWPSLGEIGGTLGVGASGGAGTAKTTVGFQGYGRVDGGRFDRPGIGASVVRVELGGSVADGGRFGARLLSLDRLMIGSVTELGPNDAPMKRLCIWMSSGTCTGGYLGVAADLLEVQQAFGGRGGLRIGEVTGVVSALPAFDDRDNVLRILPLRLGASLDYLWGIPEGGTWVGRLTVGSDLGARFADRHGELGLSFRWRPSFTGFVTDYGIEAKGSIGWVGSHRLFQPQGALVRVGLEVGYAHWETPSHGLGLGWGDGAGESFFVRLVVSGASWSIH